MQNIAEAFEDHYQKWKSFIANDAVSLSSADEDYLRNPHFEAIVNLGPGSVPYILEKLQTDDSAHFLVHALERITGKRFAPAEIEAARASPGSPLGNQGLVKLWQDWWQQHGEELRDD